MKRLIIIGAGGFGREVLGWARQCPECGRDWEPAGFLDDNPAALEGYSTDLPVLSGIREYAPQAEDRFVCAIGTPRIKKHAVEEIVARGGQFINLIHPSCLLGERVRLGQGIILCPRAVLTCDIEIGDHTALNLFTAVGHDARLGRYCQLQSYSEATGGVCLEDGVLMGTHATILPGVRVGEGATIGAGSVVVRSVKAGSSVWGAPAKPFWQSGNLNHLGSR